MKSLRNILLTALVLLATYAPALAQNVTVIGPVTPGHCTSFFSQTQVQDSGIGCGGGGGGVTSVGLALPASTFNVSGSPVTGGGTLAGSFINQPINLVFAGPATGVPAVPTWRSLVANDLAGALASPPPIGTTTPAQGAFAALSAAGNLTVSGNTITNITGSTQCVQVSATGILSGAGTLCGAAGGAVSSVSNADSTLTISPTTGAVVASLNLSHANTWIAAQTFGTISASSITDSGISGSTQCVQANASGLLSGTGSACGGAAVTSVSNADGTLTISPTTGAVVASLALGHANTWTAIQTFNNSDIRLLGSSTGFTTFTSANAGASNFTATVPANTGTIAELNLVQTWTAAQTFNNSSILLLGSSTGATTFASANASASNFTITFPAATGTVALTSGVATSVSNADGTLTISPTTGAVVASLALGHANTWTGAQSFTNADLIMLGATSGQTTLQASAAAGATVATFPANTGTVAELNLAQTFSAQQTFSSTLVFSGVGAGTQTKCLGLDVSNNVVTNAAACGGGGGTPGGSTGQIQYNNAGAFGGVPSYTNASSIFALGNTATAQQFIVYNNVDTISGPTNYERFVADWTTTANTLTLATQAGGTGTARAIALSAGNLVSGFASLKFFGSNFNFNNGANVVSAGLGAIFEVSNSWSIGWGTTGDSQSTPDTAISRGAAGVIDVGNGTAGDTSGWLNWGGEKRVTSDFSVTSSTTLTNVTGLSVSLVAGRTYRFETELFVTDAAAGGVQAAIAGTATATAIQYTGYTIADNAIKAKANATALATAYGSTVTTETAGIIVRATGVITVNAAGTLTVQMAQNTSNATATIAKRGSYLIVHDMP